MNGNLEIQLNEILMKSILYVYIVIMVLEYLCKLLLER